MCITAVCVAQFCVIDRRCSACLLQNELPSAYFGISTFLGAKL